jgi:hypothetical protein
MSFGFGFGLPSWQTLSGGFSPASLFSAGENGAWYDPSDLTTLFTDSAGTVPVTGVEQFVGLMLDKSKGLVLGPELAPAAYTGTASGGFSITSTSIVRDGVTPAGNAQLTLQATVTSGLWYKITFTAAGLSGDNTIIRVGSPTTGEFYRITSAGTYTIYLPAGVTAAILAFAPFAGTAGGITITNIGIKLIPGNHAFQTQTAKRPKLAARYNLLQRTEEFQNAAWVKDGGVTVTQNAAVAPDGTTTADLMLGTANSGMVQDPSGSLAAVNNTASLYVREGTGSQIRLRLVNASVGADFCQINFNFSTETATFSTGGTATGTTGSATKLLVGSDVWFRLTVSGVASTAAGLARAYVWGVSGSFYLWGADLRPASQATGLIGPTYQRVVDAATYDTAGFLPYLQFDGLSWSMSTNSIDFSAVPTDKMTVWAGVRKLSAINIGVAETICELSTSIAVNNGAFVLWHNNGTDRINFASKGTTRVDATTTDPIYNSLNTVVITGQADISAPNIVLRADGVQLDQDSASQGTGNYGNYPLFIGARNNAGLFFNGWLTSLIVRGAQSTQSQIEATESWVNGKTGAY